MEVSQHFCPSLLVFFEFMFILWSTSFFMNVGDEFKFAWTESPCQGISKLNHFRLTKVL